MLIKTSVPSALCGNTQEIEAYKKYLWSCQENKRNKNSRHFQYSLRDRYLYVMSKDAPRFLESGRILATQEYPAKLSIGKYAVSVQFAPIKKYEGKKKDMVVSIRNENPELYHVHSDIAHRAVATNWFEGKENHFGFHLDKIVSVECFKNTVETKSFSFSVLDITAEIEIFNTEKAIQAIQNGIGTHGAYGCGLLLIHNILNEDMK